MVGKTDIKERANNFTGFFMFIYLLLSGMFNYKKVTAVVDASTSSRSGYGIDHIA